MSVITLAYVHPNPSNRPNPRAYMLAVDLDRVQRAPGLCDIDTALWATIPAMLDIPTNTFNATASDYVGVARDAIRVVGRGTIEGRATPTITLIYRGSNQQSTLMATTPAGTFDIRRCKHTPKAQVVSTSGVPTPTTTPAKNRALKDILPETPPTTSYAQARYARFSCLIGLLDALSNNSSGMGIVPDGAVVTHMVHLTRQTPAVRRREEGMRPRPFYPMGLLPFFGGRILTLGPLQGTPTFVRTEAFNTLCARADPAWARVGHALVPHLDTITPNAAKHLNATIQNPAAAVSTIGHDAATPMTAHDRIASLAWVQQVQALLDTVRPPTKAGAI